MLLSRCASFVFAGLTACSFSAKAQPAEEYECLIEARQVLHEVRGIAFTDFDATDVVRHPLVARIVSAYEKHDVKSQE